MKTLLSAFLILVVSTTAVAQRHKTSPLDIKVNLKVHPQEILESIIFRLNEETGSIDYSSIVLAPYSAKVKHYRSTTIRQILDDRFQGTNLKYKIKGNKIYVISSLSVKNKQH